MVKQRSRGQRVVLLAVAAMLIGGGATGLSVGDRPAVAVIGAVVSILAGLVFLRMASKRHQTA
jgi:hypothetical protein